jgi:hypothetical protein
VNELDELLASDPDAWLAALPPYQTARIKQLLGDTSDYESASERWLTAKPEQTAPFGAVGSGAVYKDKLWQELEKFLCGDPAYEEQRKGLLQQKPVLHAYAVGVISTAIAPALGTSAVFLAPAVALLLICVGKVSLNAWCEMRKEQKPAAG